MSILFWVFWSLLITSSTCCIMFIKTIDEVMHRVQVVLVEVSLYRKIGIAINSSAVNCYSTYLNLKANVDQLPQARFILK